MSELSPLSKLTVGIAGAGRRTLLSVLPENRSFPANFRLCVLDVTRIDAPAQIALVDELAADPDLQVLFALNKADRISGLRSATVRTLALLRERGFPQPTIYPISAKAAKLFCQTDAEAALLPEERAVLADFYDRFAPYENSLSAYAVTEAPVRNLGSRSLTPEQQSLALINTGVPALKAALMTRDWGAAPRREPAAEKPEPPAELGFEEPEQEAVREDEAISSLLEMAEKLDCAGVMKLAKTVQNGDAPQDFRDKAMDVLQKVYLDRGREELEAMTEGIEEMDIPALQALTEKINIDLYPVQIRTPYADRVTQRIDALQREALEAICAGVEEADSRELARIWEELENADCADVLKTEFFSRIEARQETLDVEALERVTAGAETMSENDLKAVAVTLEADNWNPKFVTSYRHKIDLCRDAAVFRDLSAEMAELNDMERQEVLELREKIREKELPPRFSASAQNRIGERLYRMDMLRLMALGNDFDKLNFEGIDTLRTQAVRGDFVERAREDYLDRLLTRENALIVERTDARVQLVRQLIGQYKLRMGDFTLASLAPTYQEKLAEFWGGSGLEEPRDIPVFLLDNASDYAISGERFYYKSGRNLAFIPVADIDHLQVMKQHLSLMLQIVGKDNSYLLTECKISRSGSERTLDFLNECLRRWNEPGMADAPSANPIRTQNFEAADFTAPVENRLPDAKLALEIFRGRFRAEKLREGNLIREEEESWQQRTRRLLQNFGLPETTSLIWYCSAAVLGSVKEGIALGPKAIYQKQSKQPTLTIPLETIYCFTRSGKQVTVQTVQNQSYRLDLSQQMLPLVEEYVRTLQLGAFLRAAEEQA